MGRARTTGTDVGSGWRCRRVRASGGAGPPGDLTGPGVSRRPCGPRTRRRPSGHRGRAARRAGRPRPAGGSGPDMPKASARRASQPPPPRAPALPTAPRAGVAARVERVVPALAPGGSPRGSRPAGSRPRFPTSVPGVSPAGGAAGARTAGGPLPRPVQEGGAAAACGSRADRPLEPRTRRQLGRRHGHPLVVRHRTDASRAPTCRITAGTEPGKPGTEEQAARSGLRRGSASGSGSDLPGRPTAPTGLTPARTARRPRPPSVAVRLDARLAAARPGGRDPRGRGHSGRLKRRVAYSRARTPAVRRTPASNRSGGWWPNHSMPTVVASWGTLRLMERRSRSTP